MKVSLAKSLLDKGLSKKKITKLMSFLHYYVRFEKPETVVKFDRIINQLTKRSKTMGIEEFLLDRAKKEGERSKSTQVIRKLLKDKAYSVEEIADIVGEPIDLINKIRLSHT